jgi:hypothetical protein
VHCRSQEKVCVCVAERIVVVSVCMHLYTHQYLWHVFDGYVLMVMAFHVSKFSHDM